MLAVPRGGDRGGARQRTGAELEVVLGLKLCVLFQPEYAIGTVSEDGWLALTPDVWRVAGVTEGYLETEKRYQAAEIEWRQMVRAARSGWRAGRWS